MLRASLPRIVLSLVLIAGAFFAFFESVYLSDQAAEFHDGRIPAWMWAFRGITATLALGGLAVVFVRR